MVPSSATEPPLLEVVRVGTLPGYTLRVTFKSGEIRLFKANRLLAQPPYDVLRNKELFGQAFIGEGTVCWPGSLELNPELLFQESYPEGEPEPRTSEAEPPADRTFQPSVTYDRLGDTLRLVLAEGELVRDVSTPELKCGYAEDGRLLEVMVFDASQQVGVSTPALPGLMMAGATRTTAMLKGIRKELHLLRYGVLLGAALAFAALVLLLSER